MSNKIKKMIQALKGDIQMFCVSNFVFYVFLQHEHKYSFIIISQPLIGKTLQYKMENKLLT